jgi:hypothetical protein
MNLVNLSTAVHRLAKMVATDPAALAELQRQPVLQELLETIWVAYRSMSVSEAQPQSLSNVAWSLATLRMVDRPLVQKIAELTTTNISSFKPFELSTLLWALAKIATLDTMSCSTKPVFQAAATHIMRHVHDFAFRCLATTAWAFATVKQRHARLFRAIAAQMVPMVHTANCQEMANTAWAFGTTDYHDDALFTEFSKKALSQLEEFKAQELSNMLWGFATNGFFHEAFYMHASLAAQHMHLQAQHLANILWALARVRPRDPITHMTILALLPSCTKQLDTFKPQEVSSTVLAVAKAFGNGSDVDLEGTCCVQPPTTVLPRPVQEFFGEVIPWALSRVHEFSAQSLANTVSALVMVHAGGDEMLLNAIGQEVLTRLDSLEPTALLHLAKGFLSTPHSFGSVVHALLVGLAHHIASLRPQELQQLSRIVISHLGLSCDQPLSFEELRSYCLSLAMREAGCGPLKAAVCPSPCERPEQLSINTAQAIHTHGWACVARPPMPKLLMQQHIAECATHCGRVVVPPEQQCQGGLLSTPSPTMQRHCPPLLSVVPRATGFQPHQEVAMAAQRCFVPPHSCDPNARFTPTRTPSPSTEFAPTPPLSPVLLSDATPSSRTPGSNGARHTHSDFQWSCTVKNSFLHIEIDSSEGSDEEDGPGMSPSRRSSLEGGSMYRSCSVPSRLTEVASSSDDERCPHQVKQDWSSCHPHLGQLDFEWSSPKNMMCEVYSICDTYTDDTCFSIY